MNVDTINDPKNELNHHVYESLKGFYRQTFDPFLIVIFNINCKKNFKSK